MLWRVRACAGQRPAGYARCVVSGCGDRSVQQCRLAVAAAARLGLGVVLVVAVALLGWGREVGPWGGAVSVGAFARCAVCSLAVIAGWS
jgi:hypothetical protein